MADLSTRSRQEEQMDAPDLDPAIYERVLHDLARVNRWTFTAWTAVTLYSGQLVAQSELSVVTTLAPDSGKWKVV